MRHKISLLEYVNLGGDIDKLDLSLTSMDYYDKNYLTPIKSIKLLSVEIKNGSPDRKYFVTFENGNEKIYHEMWLNTIVDITLDSKYL